ncbi:TIGR02186 family protein [Pinisolibacter sp.]|uniref:TIGR02186 family protein n=1 Tax=Pinisolibacter sp. TaxID=2172024 RepID=UPI002FDDDF12
MAATRTVCAALFGLAALFGAAVPTVAETLIAEVSTKRVAIASNFSGTDLTVYGSVERDAMTVSRASGYDIAVMLIGPRRTVVTRRKDRVLGIWVNRDWRTYDAPAFYALATTKPVEDLATEAQLDAHQIGIDHLILPEGVPGGVEVLAGAAEFRDAFTDHQRKAGMYAEYPGAVRLLSSHLFSATLPIPAEVPVGRYSARVLVLSDGSPVAEHVSEIEVTKIGFEQKTADLAAHRSVLYGLVSVLIAVMTGWLGGVLFRRD